MLLFVCVVLSVAVDVVGGRCCCAVCVVVVVVCVFGLLVVVCDGVLCACCDVS